MQHLKSITAEVLAEMMATDPAMKKIGTAFYDYLEMVQSNTLISEKAYLDSRKD